MGVGVKCGSDRATSASSFGEEYLMQQRPRERLSAVVLGRMNTHTHTHTTTRASLKFCDSDSDVESRSPCPPFRKRPQCFGSRAHLANSQPTVLHYLARSWPTLFFPQDSQEHDSAFLLNIDILSTPRLFFVRNFSSLRQPVNRIFPLLNKTRGTTSLILESVLRLSLVVHRKRGLFPFIFPLHYSQRVKLVSPGA